MELTRQNTPPTKNGHAQPPIESRKGFQPVGPYYVLTWWALLCWVKLIAGSIPGGALLSVPFFLIYLDSYLVSPGRSLQYI